MEELAWLSLAAALLAGCGGEEAGTPSSSSTGAAASSGAGGSNGLRDDLLVDMDAFLQSEEAADGVAHDPRVTAYPTEQIRLTIAPQLLGYYELYKKTGDDRFLEDVAVRADYLRDHSAEAISGGPFDGMIGYALLCAAEATGDAGYKAAAEGIVATCLALPETETILNGGLMCAMALAKADGAAAEARMESIVDSLAPYQNPDKSFPHWCVGSEDLHYSSWMAMELLLIDAAHPYAPARAFASSITSFVRSRIGADGEPTYADASGIYYSLGTGCAQDYDTRGWSNELGYHLLALGSAGVDAAPVRAFLGSLVHEGEGAVPDKWSFPPDPSDSVYPFANAPRSILRTSLVFWSLAAAY